MKGLSALRAPIHSRQRPSHGFSLKPPIPRTETLANMGLVPNILLLILLAACTRTLPSSDARPRVVAADATMAPRCAAAPSLAPTRDACRAGSAQECMRLGYRLAQRPDCDIKGDELIARVTSQCRAGNAESCGAVGALNATR